MEVRCRLAGLVVALAWANSCGAAPTQLATGSRDGWRVERRGTAEFSRRGISTTGQMALWKGQEFGDIGFRCRARIAEGVRDGAAWLRFRYRSDNEHYALGLRGWPSNDLFLLRFGPQGGDRLLAREPLGSEAVPGKWYDLRVTCVADAIEVTLNNEPDPRLTATDPAPLAAGLVGVGGGYRAAEYADLTVEAAAAEGEESARAARRARAAAAAQRAARAASRAGYRPVVLPEATAGRQTVSLDGTWLFLPGSEVRAGQDPRDPKVGEGGWGGLAVPGWWTPRWWWLYGPGEGASERWVEEEKARVAGLGFDSEQTHSGWYRQWLIIPRSYTGKRLAVQFDGVAMACEVYLNGTQAGRHAGMFAPFEVELPSEAIRWGGRNLLAVQVTDAAEGGSPDALPRGMYSRSAGIWQPAALLATERTYLAEAHAMTRMDGLEVEVSVGGEPGEGLRCRGTVTDRADGTTLAALEAPVVDGRAALAQGGLTPKLWTPDAPSLYQLRVALQAADGRVLDERVCAIGFRTFEARGNRLYLNGRPYWLRGAGLPPSALAGQPPEVAQGVLRAMHVGNTVVLRAQASAFPETWLQAADEVGIGVSMEGVWPWLMMDDAPPPSDEQLAAWEAEWLAQVRLMRNHPCVLMWTLNNESYWYRARDPGLRKRKWEIATRLIRATRAVDPTRPVVCDSGYVRDPGTYAQELEPNGFDDGDLDDAHAYPGWYGPGPWSWYPSDGEPPLEAAFSGTRPAIFQEFSTGYPNTDTGHPTRKYVTDHSVPQAWVGDYAYEDRDPSVYLDRQAWMTRELTELARRHRSKLCGLLAFSSSNWFRFPYDPGAMEPYPVYGAMQRAMAPILVSADLRQRHFYAGDALTFSATIVNDAADGADLPSTVVQAELLGPDGAALARGAVQVPPVPYYTNRTVALSVAAPAVLPSEARAEYRLALALKAGEAELARSEYPLLGASREWAGLAEVGPALSEALTAGEGGTLIANGSAGVEALRARPELQAFVQGGGRVLVMNAGAAVRDLLPEVVQEAVSWRPEVVNVEDEASPLLDGLEPWDVCWLNAEQGMPVAATGGFRVAEGPEVRVLATAIRPHGYLQAPEDVALHSAVVVFEAQVGKGKVVVSELAGVGATTDPIGARLVANLLRYAAG